MKLNILFRTKGGHKEGMGDIISSLSLAGEFQKRGHEIQFFINNNKNVIDLVSRSFAYSIAQEIPEILQRFNNNNFDIAVLNQLNTPLKEAEVLKRHSRKLVTMEDTGEAASLADVRFNILYPIKNAITDLAFIPLANTFQNKHSKEKKIEERVNNILVTQGGSDTYGFTPKILKSLYSVSNDINVNVVIGPNFSHITELNEVLTNSPRSFAIIKNKTDLSDIMLDADVAISAGGNTIFELSCLGVPSIVVCAELFEVDTAKRIESAGAAINLGFGQYIQESEISSAVDSLMHNVSLRKKMSMHGKKLIDGYGIERIVETILKNFYA